METTATRTRVNALLARKGLALVVGAGVTGQAVAELLREAHFSVSVLDERGISAAARKEFDRLDVEVIELFSVSDQDPSEFAGRGFAFAVLSPGVDSDGPLAQFLSRAGIPKMSEVDLGIAFLGMPEVAVTGTNGKTTTVTLIHQMLLEAGREPRLVGNVGKPFVNLVSAEDVRNRTEQASVPRSVLVAEVSSYQLEAAYDFVPRVAVWLNIDEDHLERHGTIDDYLRVKSRIFSGQSADTDWALLWADDRRVEKMRSFVHGRELLFGAGSEERLRAANGCFFLGEEILFSCEGNRESYSIRNWKLIGLHNKINLTAAVAASRLAGASSKAVQQTIDSFAPLPHRLELVRLKDEVMFINDSKATNVSAARAAIDAVRESHLRSKLVLLLGGKAKTADWNGVHSALDRGVRAVICFGADGDQICKEVGKSLPIHLETEIVLERVTELSEGLLRAEALALPGDIVLLSPGCASFDHYSSYAERGEHFRELVMNLDA